ncbi:hypothetical protein LCGC14_2277690 [marine sediment metagenome]|uniref:Uncharacterized protein n=1 Tax=marine sediment metagenome TaxID=412755 RepID=A0A0F9FQ75_9ZZZZ
MLENIKKFVDIYANILGVCDQKFEFHEGTDAYQAELDWNELKGVWIISYDKDDIGEYYFAHEVGHIYLAKKYNFEGFSKPMRKEDEPNIDFNIALLLNMCLDGFVDYHICQFDEIYPCMKIKYLTYVEDLQNTFSYTYENKDYIEVLGWYIVWFQIFNYIIDRKNRILFKKEISELFSFTKKHLLRFKGGMSKDQFDKLTEKIKLFKNTTKSKDAKQLILYSANVIIGTGIWDRTKVLKNIKYFYPTIKELF